MDPQDGISSPDPCQQLGSAEMRSSRFSVLQFPLMPRQELHEMVLKVLSG